MEVLKKNDMISLEITDVTNEGNGVGRYNGIAVFVPATAVGDIISCRIVKVKARIAMARWKALHKALLTVSPLIAPLINSAAAVVSDI